MASLTETHAHRIVGTLSCFDRIIITGSLVDIAYAEATAKTLRIGGIRLFNYARFAEPLRDEVRANAERLAGENGLTVEYLSKKNFRKEERVKALLKERGDQPGLVHIFSAMESCPSFRPGHDKKTGPTFVKGREAKCLHNYFYFIDEDLGLCYLRVPQLPRSKPEHRTTDGSTVDCTPGSVRAGLVQRDGRLADLENRLSLEQGHLFRKGMEGVNVQLMIAGVEINEAERGQPVVRPLVEGDEDPTVLGVVNIVAMGGGEKLRRHPFNLG